MREKSFILFTINLPSSSLGQLAGSAECWLATADKCGRFRTDPPSRLDRPSVSGQKDKRSQGGQAQAPNITYLYSKMNRRPGSHSESISHNTLNSFPEKRGRARSIMGALSPNDISDLVIRLSRWTLTDPAPEPNHSSLTHCFLGPDPDQCSPQSRLSKSSQLASPKEDNETTEHGNRQPKLRVQQRLKRAAKREDRCGSRKSAHVLRPDRALESSATRKHGRAKHAKDCRVRAEIRDELIQSIVDQITERGVSELTRILDFITRGYIATHTASCLTTPLWSPRRLGQFR